MKIFDRMSYSSNILYLSVNRWVRTKRDVLRCKSHKY